MNALLLTLCLAAEPQVAPPPEGHDEIGGTLAGMADLSDRFGAQGRVNANFVYGHQFAGTGIEGRFLVGVLATRHAYDKSFNHGSAALQLLFNMPVRRLVLTLGVGFIASLGEEYFLYYPDRPFGGGNDTPIRYSNFSAHAGGQTILGFALEPASHLVMRTHLRIDLTPLRYSSGYTYYAQPSLIPTLWLEVGFAFWR